MSTGRVAQVAAIVAATVLAALGVIDGDAALGVIVGAAIPTPGYRSQS